MQLRLGVEQLTAAILCPLPILPSASLSTPEFIFTMSTAKMSLVNVLIPPKNNVIVIKMFDFVLYLSSAN